MPDHIVLRVVSRLLFPFIILFGLYIQLHGDYSPGGGFQAGVICAAAFILVALIYGLDVLRVILPHSIVRCGASLGLLLYASVGVVAMFKGGAFLDYSALSVSPVLGQQVGIMTIELGVGITVFSVMMLIVYSFAGRGES